MNLRSKTKYLLTLTKICIFFILALFVFQFLLLNILKRVFSYIEIYIDQYLNIFMTLLLCIAIYWLLFSLAAFYFVTKAIKYYSNQPKLTVPDHYQAFMRKDFGKWNQFQIKKGCFLKLPLKATVLLIYLLGFIFLAFLKKYINFPNKVIDFWRNYVGLGSMKLCFDLQQDFNRNQMIRNPITIANHVSWFDFNYLNSVFRLHSPIAKIEVQKIFGLNVICEYGQSVYVDRTATNGRHCIFEAIKNRINEFQQCKDDTVNPILIFPEGTVSNGRALMTFKNGAFQNLTPLTVFSLRYECKQFHVGMDQVNAFYYTVILLCLNPKLIVKKRLVNPLAGETVDGYRERCRKIIAQMGQFPIIESTYRDIVEYQKMKKQAKKSSK